MSPIPHLPAISSVASSTLGEEIVSGGGSEGILLPPDCVARGSLLGAAAGPCLHFLVTNKVLMSLQKQQESTAQS